MSTLTSTVSSWLCHITIYCLSWQAPFLRMHLCCAFSSCSLVPQYILVIYSSVGAQQLVAWSKRCPLRLTASKTAKWLPGHQLYNVPTFLEIKNWFHHLKRTQTQEVDELTVLSRSSDHTIPANVVQWYVFTTVVTFRYVLEEHNMGGPVDNRWRECVVHMFQLLETDFSTLGKTSFVVIWVIVGEH